MHAVRRRIDEARQRVGIGRFQLRDLPPVEDFLRQLVALLRKLFQRACAGRPLPGLGFGAARQAELAEQDIAELLGAARIDRLAGELLDLGFKASGLLREFAGQPRQHLPVDRDAAPLHMREHAKERPLQRLIHREHMLGREPRLEHLPEPQHDVGLLGGVFGRLVDADGIESDLGLARFDQRVDLDRRMLEDVFGERRQRVVLPAGIERVRHQHGVVVGRDLDAAQRENLPSEFQIVADLEHALVREQRLERIERHALGNLIGRDVAAEQARAPSPPWRWPSGT